ncbi:MAG TPA: hypothetical protein EYQ42_11455 [Thiotrichaceae bacterium]|jgi:hypothetical protein|nr:hypothetical protein [Thiotrichaceae bacterium]HIM08796.1 hypothetical protein [Gammaproteobacteria bacterium]
MFKNIRILILLYILLMVAVGGWLSKANTTDWDKPLEVVIYAINADGSSTSQKYIDKLENSDFNDIEEFFQGEAKAYNLALKKPVDVSFAGELKEKPPLPPRQGSQLSIIIWSLKLRYWAWQNDNYPYPEDVQIFVLYFDPEETKTVAHSLGLQKGLVGVVNAFASKKMKKENHVIIAHELLHTVGAVDKYDPRTNQPLYPIGYANPEQSPLHPQKKAEIMAGRIAVAENKAKQPEKLKQVILGEATAIEINWLAIPE